MTQPAPIPQRAIALTIDDLPFQGQQPPIQTLRATNQVLVERLVANRIPAIGFANDDRSGRSTDPKRRRRLAGEQP
ncbi:MAG TPA: hypothetical protein VMT85_15805 [Thermoanaerobaculia bacterium]|nr:hypothetical protein [Thermoanaerobaculia bacterium]